MPNCFQLKDKETGTPIVLQKLDEMICEHLNEPVHEVHWCHGWYDAIGFMIAMGKATGSSELRAAVAEYSDPKLITILDFIESKFTSNAWVEIGRR